MANTSRNANPRPQQKRQAPPPEDEILEEELVGPLPMDGNGDELGEPDVSLLAQAEDDLSNDQKEKEKHQISKSKFQINANL